MFLLLTAATAAAVLTGKGNTVQAARETVEAFCRNEFEGSEPETRERLVRFSPEVEAEFQKREHPWLSKHVTIPPLVVVSAYEVKDVRVDGNLASAVVAYRRLARTENQYRNPYISDKKDNDLVTLTLVFDEGWRPSDRSVPFATVAWNFVFIRDQWRVLDPPVPRISKQTLLEYYESELKWYVDRKKEIGELPEHQQDAYDRKSGIFRFLKSLP